MKGISAHWMTNPSFRWRDEDSLGKRSGKVPGIQIQGTFVLEDGTIIPNTKLTKPSAPPRSYAYCSDTAYFPRITEQIKNADVLFHEATFEESDISRAKQTHHSTAKQAAQIALDAQVKRLLIGHFSARYEDENNLLQEARSIFPQTFLANENMVFKL